MKVHRALAATVLLSLAAQGAGAQNSGQQPANLEPAIGVDETVALEWGVKIPLRDGVHLNATVYRPAGAAAPAPCVFTLTPYISATYHERGMYFASHGFPFLTIDVRGRGNSEGVFHPLIQEAKDGYDIVEWLARQPYCNGRVTMWGGSYAGYDQWATATQFPPHLATIVPVAAPAPGIDFPALHNVFYSYDLQWLTYTAGHAAQESIFSDAAFWIAAYRRWSQSGRPFRELDQIVGNPSPIFQEWLSHPDEDEYWRAYNPTAAQYAKLNIPVLTITGMYDGDQAGALTHYRRYMQSATPEGRARHYLIIGPWDHPGTRTPKAEFGGMKFGPASLVDLPQLHLDWYRWTMQGAGRPDFLKAHVVYYVTGAERWRSAPSLEAVTGESRPLLLGSTGDANDLYTGGTLGPTRRGTAKSDHYLYDPRDTALATLEEKPFPESLVDERTIAASRSNLVYHSDPVPADTELSGFFRCVAYIGIDQPDTDFYAQVFEVGPDGSVIPLASDFLRARYRESSSTPKFVTSSAPLRYDFNHFTFASRLVHKGSRLRLVLRAGDTIFMEKNFNAGGIVAEESAKDARLVVVTLYHDTAHPSTLYIPLAASETAQGLVQ